MATVMTRFEIFLPLYYPDTPEGIAVQTFRTNLSSLCMNIRATGVYMNTPTIVDRQGDNVVSLITTAQQPTALGYLNQLNTDLVAAGRDAVQCMVNQVTSEP